MESLNKALVREGFKEFSYNTFAGISRVVVHSITAKIYEIIASHELQNRKMFEMEQTAMELQTRNDSVVKELEDAINAKTILENKVVRLEVCSLNYYLN